MSSITKISFARGIAQGLQARGLTQFNHTDAIKVAADTAALSMDFEPAFEDATAERVAKIAAEIIEINNGAHAGYKTASQEKLAFFSNETLDDDLMAQISTGAGHLLDKFAAANQPGTHVGSGPMDNSLAFAATQSNMGAMEQAARPQGYANVGQGNTNFSEEQAARIGKEQPHPGQQPHKAPNGGNSVVNASKQAAVVANLRKLAGGENQHGASPDMSQSDNSVHAAAGQSQMGADEAARRPSAYANVGQGNTNFSEPQSSRVGEEQAHPLAESHGGAPDNSVTVASKSAAFNAHFNAVAQEIGPALERMGLSIEDRTQTVKHAMQLEPQQVPHFMHKLAKQLGYEEVPQTRLDIASVLGSLGR